MEDTGLNFDEVKQSLQEYLQGDEIRGWLREPMIGRLQAIVQFATNQIERWLVEDLPYWKCPEDKKQLIYEVLDALLKAVIRERLSGRARLFISGFLQLVFNLNKRMRSQRIAIRIDDIQRILAYREGVIEAIEALRQLLKQVERLKDFTPPAFQLSRHYLESLERHIAAQAETHREHAQKRALARKSLKAESGSECKYKEQSKGKGGEEAETEAEVKTETEIERERDSGGGDNA